MTGQKPVEEYIMPNTWSTQGFKAFSAGTCGNSGHNLYISRSGVLQRIHQYDFDKTGNLDLVFCNSQDHLERPPVGIYHNPLNKLEYRDLPAEGARSGAVLDLNGVG